MIEITQNITSIKSGVVVQQVDCRGAYGSAINKFIASRYPQVKVEYRKLDNRLSAEGIFGCVHFIPITDQLIIANSYSQLDFGDPRITGKVYTDVSTLIGNIEYVIGKYPQRHVYVPYGIGAGLGGADWNMIQVALLPLDVTVVRQPFNNLI